MTKKAKIAAIISGATLLAFSTFPVLAQQSNPDQDIPERDGVYNVPNHPNLKVRVFVHGPRPEPSSSPSLICSLSDPDSSAKVNPTGWHLPGNWTYQLNRGSVPSSVGGTNLETIANNAFTGWSNASAGKVTFTRGADTTVSQKGLDGKNIIAWGRTSGTALAVTYTWYYPSTGLVAEEDTIMNKKFPWSWTPYNSSNLCADSSSYDAQDILTHETGHWMGLDDEYSTDFVNNTMYGYGAKGEVKKDTLTSGDTSGISAIYP